MTGRRSMVMTVAHGLRRVYWRLARPVSVGVCCLVVDRADDGRVLLVQQSYGPRRWTLPGGSPKRGETLAAAAARELAEETGVTLPGGAASLRLHGLFAHHEGGRTDHVAVYAAEDWTPGETRSIEIAASGWFPVDALPSPMSGAARRRVEEHLGRRPVSPDW